MWFLNHPADTYLFWSANADTPHPLLPMSEVQLNAFLQAVKADAGLQEKFNAADDTDSLLAVEREAGFVFSADELQKSQAEVSDDELENVAGGLLGSAQNCDADIHTITTATHNPDCLQLLINA